MITVKPANAWTRCALLILALPVAGCVGGVSGEALCVGTVQARTDHAAALADDGGDRSVVTGAALIGMLDAGCGDG